MKHPENRAMTCINIVSILGFRSARTRQAAIWQA